MRLIQFALIGVVILLASYVVFMYFNNPSPAEMETILKPIRNWLFISILSLGLLDFAYAIILKNYENIAGSPVWRLEAIGTETRPSP